jgi:protein involved in polysaccharide export with SLBB domain
LKPGSEPAVPVGAAVRNASGAEGAPESNRNAQPAPGVPAPSANTPPAPTAKPASAAPPAVSPADVYRIGTGDILDIRLLNGQDPRQNTLYSVVAGGVLDYPLLRDPLTVAGMTTDELAAQLVAEFRHRGLYERPQVRVSVREYASHAVLVSGLVNDPGTKILRREAIPLYVVVAESQPKPEAGRAVIISHSSGKIVTVDLNDAAALNTLVQSGDVVTLTVRPPEFFYVGGEINAPGQKDFHSGITLTQALLASGGVTRTAGDRVRVSRQGADGRLVSTEYNLREIEGGVAPDPALRPGDRVEVSPAKRK